MRKVCVGAVISACYPLFVSMIMMAVMEAVNEVLLDTVCVVLLVIFPAIGYVLARWMIQLLQRKINDDLPQILQYFFYFQFVVYTFINVLTADMYYFLHAKMEYVDAVSLFYQK